MESSNAGSVDARVASCAQTVRLNKAISSLLRSLVGPGASVENFAAELASYHFVANLDSEECSRKQKDDFQAEITRFRRALEVFQRESGTSFPGLLETLGMIERRAWESRGNNDWWPQRGVFPLAGAATLDDYLSNIADRVEDDGLATHPDLDWRIRTPQGRLAKAGKSRAILYAVRTLERWEMSHGADFCKLAKLCVQILVNEAPEDREITTRYRKSLT